MPAPDHSDMSKSAATSEPLESPDVMPLSDLLADDRLRLREHVPADGPAVVRWAHAIELADPARYLRGGELVMTTGLPLRGEVRPDVYVHGLVAAGVAALAFGTGLGNEEVPAAVVAACRRCHLPLIEVPLETPFIAVAQAVADHLGEQRARREHDAQLRSRALTRAAVRSGPSGVTVTLARLLNARVVLTDRDLRVRHRGGTHGPDPDLDRVKTGRPGAHHVDGAGDVTEFQPLGERPDAELGWLVVRRSHGLTGGDRAVVAHASALLTLLMSAHSARTDAQEAALVGLLTSGSAQDSHVGPALPPGPVAAVVVFPSDRERKRALEQTARAHRARPLVGGTAEEAVLVVATAEASGLAADLVRVDDTARVGLGHAVASAADLPASAAAARSAARTAELGEIRDVTARPLDVLLDDEVVRDRVAGVVAPLVAALQRADPAWLTSARAHLDEPGSHERAARLAGVHRHTLRAHLRSIEEATGIDLDDGDDRLLLTLALRMPATK